MELNMCKIVAAPPNQIKDPSTENPKISLNNGQQDGCKINKCNTQPEKVPERKLDEKIKSECVDVSSATELLGSVTTHNCPGTRTSARVIQKMKQDQTRPITPPPNERDHSGKNKDDKNTQKTPSQVRPQRTIWTNLERNYFFDALNEFGKDFEAITNCVNGKLKRRGTSDFPFKTKEQVRLHYYQTYHKICKYIRYSDEIKKPAQELYTLINYGEMRRKMQFLSEKHFLKLRQLIYQGHITIRFKGKNIRIKTPSCKALRRLNQLDDTLEDIRLPTKIEVIVAPANMEAFGRVQALAQNPRARATVPLHKKLANFIKTFQFKWRSHNAKLAEEELKLFPNLVNDIPANVDSNTSTLSASYVSQADSEMCFRPKPGVPIHRPLLSITEYLSSVNICLSAYEERMGVRVRSETINYEQRHMGQVSNSKRQRTESGSEKRSPDSKKTKPMHSPAYEKSSSLLLQEIDHLLKEDNLAANEAESNVTMQSKVENSSGDELSDELHDLLSDNLLNEANKIDLNPADANVASMPINGSSTAAVLTGTPAATQARNKRTVVVGGGGGVGGLGGNTNISNIKISTRSNSFNFKPLLNDDSVKNIRKGWTVSKAADITVGDLYVVLGQDSKLELEYYWREASSVATTSQLISAATNELTEQLDVTSLMGDAVKYEKLKETVGVRSQKSAKATLTISNKLKHLLLIANLSDRVRKRSCLCGHNCEGNATKTRIKSYVTNAIGNSDGIMTAPVTPECIFRQPITPVRKPILSIDPVKQPLTRQKLSRHVLVQRRLLPPGRFYNQLATRQPQNNYIDATKLGEVVQVDEMNNGGVIDEYTNQPLPSIDNNKEVNQTNLFAQTKYDAESSNLYAHNTSHDIRNDPNTCLSSPSAADNIGNDSLQLDLASWNSTTNSYKVNVSSNNDSNLPRNCNRVMGNSMPSLDFVEEALLTRTTTPETANDESTTANFFNGMMSPMHLLRDSTSNSRWLEDNLNDFSLTSLLGHLDEINATRDILDPSSNMSVISESSVDYRHKFQEITALMQSQDKD